MPKSMARAGQGRGASNCTHLGVSWGCPPWSFSSLQGIRMLDAGLFHQNLYVFSKILFKVLLTHPLPGPKATTSAAHS